jgi:VCBS repeat-containing protein
MREKLFPILALTILLAATLVDCGGPASSTPSPLAILSEAVGDVSVSNTGADSWTAAHVGMSLETGDGIKTGDNSSAEITFLDGSTIELEANTEIDIVSLEISTDTGSKTITLDQIIGDTISRVTHLVGSESSYEVDTPDGVAGVRGSGMRVQVIFDNPNYEDGTALVTNLGGSVYTIAHGVEVDVPVGQTCILVHDQPPDLVPVAADDAWTTEEDAPLGVEAPGVLDNDLDPDAGDTLTVTAVDTSGTVGAVTAWNPDGSFTYDPNGQFEYLQAGSSATDTFTYTVSDGKGGIDTATVAIVINGVNDPPVAADDDGTTLEHTRITIPVLDNDSDPDAGDTLTVTSVTQGTHGQVFNNGNDVTYAPDFGFSGLDTFTYTVSDGNGGTDTARVTIHVNIIETQATIDVSVQQGPSGNVYIWDDLSNWWAFDERTGEPIDGTHHETHATITVAAGRRYYVWLHVPGGTYYDVTGYPSGWTITSSPVGDYEAAYGYAATDTVNYVYFNIAS